MHGATVNEANGRLTIRLNHPPENRLTIELLEEISTSLETQRYNDDLKLIVFETGLDGIFSRGFPIQDRMPENAGQLVAAFGHLLYILNELPAIILARIDGICLGGAMELAAFCDILLASDRTRFGHPEIRSGLYPPVAAALYPHHIGRNRTMEILTTSREFDAKELHSYGLVNHIFPTQDFKEKSEEICARIESNSAFSLRMTKKAIESSLYEKVIPAIRISEEIYLNELLQSHDAREGLQATIEGRAPQWKNR